MFLKDASMISQLKIYNQEINKRRNGMQHLAVGKPLNPVLRVSEIEVKVEFKIQFNCCEGSL